uniref:SJCHGC04855 protein n=1 Tax=Schistosoma japonicum TaxID=6182 RepID=Q5DBI3_SCHJA|nr:SJCHGC04855 protein [Schistosoma japonicum]
MGNYVNYRTPTLTKRKDKHLSPINILNEHSKVLSIDPRSPSDGIVRTPIQINKDDPRSPSPGVIRTPIGCSGHFSVERLNFLNSETPDGVLTEDDSLHRGDKSSALSDTEVTNNTKNETHIGNTNNRVRLSWLEKPFKRKSLNDSPGLFVRFRQKQNYEKCKTKDQRVCENSVTHTSNIPQANS